MHTFIVLWPKSENKKASASFLKVIIYSTCFHREKIAFRFPIQIKRKDGCETTWIYKLLKLLLWAWNFFELRYKNALRVASERVSVWDCRSQVPWDFLKIVKTIFELNTSWKWCPKKLWSFPAGFLVMHKWMHRTFRVRFLVTTSTNDVPIGN